ncbi:MAG TPA: NAD-dependent succinate-semialdehyde dehydrogenase [Terriglobia bacterium]|nr:NAD-dependent succinate-semialdehyde dehydrogenase [Terriglobia bacterium]
MSIISVNPSTGVPIQSFETLTPEELDLKLARATLAFGTFRHTSITERARWLAHAAEILEHERDPLARMATTEMGKTIQAARDELIKCAWSCRYFAENAESWLADETVESGRKTSFVHYQPLGAVLAIMPWNFPFWQVFRFAGSAIIAGNVVLLKHASNVPRCALAIEDVFHRAGFPPGVFQTLLIRSQTVGRVIEDPRIVAVTLTGSERAGAEVAAQAGKHIKKTVLELGGSDPFIVMSSADPSAVAAVAVRARTINNGESCVASKRFIVHDSVYDDFERRFVGGMARLQVGDPQDDATDIGPLATEQVLETLERQVSRLVAGGASVLTGGARLHRPGYFYPPTVLTNIDRSGATYREELFGPVAMLFRVHGADDAIALANETSFGLGASIWTQDPVEQRRFIEEIEAGVVVVNDRVSSDPRMPFGGVKHSGYGRELGRFGVREFTNIKTVRIAA